MQLPPHLIPMSMQELRSLIRCIRLSLKDIPYESSRSEMAALAQRFEDELVKMEIKVKEFEAMTEEKRRATIERLRKQCFN